MRESNIRNFRFLHWLEKLQNANPELKEQHGRKSLQRLQSVNYNMCKITWKYENHIVRLVSCE